MQTSERFYIGEHVPLAHVQPVITPRVALDGRNSAADILDLIGHDHPRYFNVVKDNVVIGFIGVPELQFAIVSGRGHKPIDQLLAVRFLFGGGLQSA